jgi:hypothetical protein
MLTVDRAALITRALQLSQLIHAELPLANPLYVDSSCAHVSTTLLIFHPFFLLACSANNQIT